MDHKGEVFFSHYYLQHCTRLKGERREIFGFEQIYFSYCSVFHLGHMYDTECIHTHRGR